jgi:hypothetical protein
LTIETPALFLQAIENSAISANVGIAVVPGSRVWLDRKVGALRVCTAAVCRGSRNYAPFTGSTTLVGSLRGGMTQAEISRSYDFLSYLASPELTSRQVINSTYFISPFRTSQTERDLWANVTFPQPSQLDQLLAVSVTAGTSNNIAIDLQIPNSTYYRYVMSTALRTLLLEQLNDTDPLITNISDSWKAITNKVGFDSQYRAYLLSLDAFWLLGNTDNNNNNHDTATYIVAIMVPIIAALLFLTLLGLIALLIATLIMWKRRKNSQVVVNMESIGWILDYDELELLERIGVGSFGDVYRGIYRGTEVATKKLRGDLTVDGLQEFLNEMAVMCELRHPNVLLFMGACVEPKNQCIVTEFMPRGSLYDVLHDESLVLDWQLLKTMAVDAARGMEYLHSADPPVLHRDFKSLNLLIDKKWNLKVADFGLTVLADAHKDDGGSLLWSAPEVLRQEPFTIKSDVYRFVMCFIIVDGLVEWIVTSHPNIGTITKRERE